MLVNHGNQMKLSFIKITIIFIILIISGNKGNGQDKIKSVSIYYKGGSWNSSPIRKLSIQDAGAFEKVSEIKDKSANDSLYKIMKGLFAMQADSCNLDKFNGVKLRIKFEFKDSELNFYFIDDCTIIQENFDRCLFADSILLLYLWEEFLPDSMKIIKLISGGKQYSPYFPILNNDCNQK